MWRRLGSWLILIAAGVLAIARLEPPNEDRDGFDSQRALNHLRTIAAEPHPGGSPRNAIVRDYLISQFTALGFDVQTQPFQASNADLANIVARRTGTTPGHALMLTAHYDSVRAGPGASDDGAAVAALLEVARILSADPHRNDLVFLITDGEEMGLLGAQAFTDQPNGAAGISAVLNFEARGTSGPSIMFQTSRGNRWLIEQFARNAPHPIASSLTDDVYQRMPNDTDFTIFDKVANIPGLNFAYIGGVQNYHRATDSIERLDLASLRHHGMQALALARVLLDADLTLARSDEDVVYFDVLGFGMVRYPARYIWPMALGATLLAAMALMRHILNMPRKRSEDEETSSATRKKNAGAGAWLIWISVCVQLLAWIGLTLLLAHAVRGASYLAVWPLIAFSFARLMPKTLQPPLILVAGLIAVILIAPPIFLSILALTRPVIAVGFVVLALLIAPIRTGSKSAHRSR